MTEGASRLPGGAGTAGGGSLLEGIDLVVFDKDGTLIDFAAMWSGWAVDLGRRLEAGARRPVAPDVFAAIGFDPSSGRVAPAGPLARLTMGGIHELVTAVLRRWCPSPAAARRVVAEAWFEPDPVALAVPLADLAGLFTALRATGRRIAVATTDDRTPTEATLAALGVAPLVDAIACGDDGTPVKPDPGMVLAVCERVGVSPARTAVVGDSPADLLMGRGADVALAVGVLSGVGTADVLGPLADTLLPSIAALADPVPTPPFPAE